MSASQPSSSAPFKGVRLSTLLNYIEENNYSQLEADLKSPDCALIDKSTNMNLMHIAATMGDLKTFEIIFQSLPEETIATLSRSVMNAADDVSNDSDSDGTDCADDINDFIAMPTTSVKLREDLPENDKQVILKMLEALPLTGNIRPCHELIDEKEIARRYPNASGELLEHLTAAVWAMNRVRSLGIQSSNHPDSIHKIKSSAELDKLVDQNGAVIIESRYEDIDSKKQSDKIKTNKTGNCEQWAQVAKEFLKEKGEKIYYSTHLLEFENSDHVFLCMGNKNRVYFDPWAGTFGIEADLEKTICGSFAYWSNASQKVVSCRTIYNPNFHKTKLVYEHFRKPIKTASPSKNDEKTDLTERPTKKLRTDKHQFVPTLNQATVSGMLLFTEPKKPNAGTSAAAAPRPPELN